MYWEYLNMYKKCARSSDYIDSFFVSSSHLEMDICVHVYIRYV